MKEINIGKNIYQRRKQKGITQDELAEYMGVSKASVSKWENGQSYPDITFLPILATYFNISVDELIGYLPQMSLQDVKKLYVSLSDLFQEKPYEFVLGKIHYYTKKYYSCYILQFYMAVLLVNYGVTAKDNEQKVIMLQEAYEICERIVAKNDDLQLSNQALSMQATAALMLNQPEKVVMLLEEQLQPKANNETLLANAYMMMGKKAESEHILQFIMFGNLVNLTSELQTYLGLKMDQPEQFDEVLNRCLALNDAFHIDDFHQNVMAQVYMSGATGYMMQGRKEQAMDMLNHYADVCAKFTFPVRLHGDTFFSDIDDMLDEFQIGSVTPRNEQAIRNTILEAVTQNPLFEGLKEEKEYKAVIRKLEKFAAKKN